jgi:hypothetical protein
VFTRFGIVQARDAIERASELVATLAERTSWQASALAHARVYREITANRAMSRVA